MDILYSLQHLGYVIPPQADAVCHFDYENPEHRSFSNDWNVAIRNEDLCVFTISNILKGHGHDKLLGFMKAMF